MENWINLACGVQAITLLWIMAWLANRLYRKFASDSQWDGGEFDQGAMLFTLFLALTSAIPFYGPAIQDVAIINRVAFALTGSGVVSLVVLGRMANRLKQEGKAVSTDMFIVVPLIVMMGLLVLFVTRLIS